MQGTGRWGKNLLSALCRVEGIEPTWIVDPDPDALAEAARIAPQATAVRRIEETGFDFDAAVIATPAADHADHVRFLLERGKHVLVEKPAAMDEPHANALTTDAAVRGLCLMVGHQLCFHPKFERLQQEVERGLIGGVTHVRSVRTGPVDFTKEPGVLWSYGPHDLSMLLGLFGRVTECSDIQARRNTDGLPTAAKIRLTVEPHIPAEIFLDGEGDDKTRLFTVRGARGTLEFDDAVPGGRLIHTNETGDRQILDVPPGPDALTRECAHFAACVRTGDMPLTGGAHLVRIIEIIRDWG